MNKYFVSLLVIISFFINGCTLIFKSHQKSTIISATKGTTIEISNVEDDNISAFKEIGQDTIVYKLKNNTENYLVRLKKDNYITSTYPIIKTKFNVNKVFDIGIPLVADIILLAYGGDIIDAVGAPAVFIGSFGWFSNLFGKWHIYEEKYFIPELNPIRRRNNNEKYLYVDKVNFDINSKNYTWSYFKDYSKYKEREKLHSGQFNKTIKIKNLSYKDYLNKLLTDNDYIDTVNKLLSRPYNTLKLTCDVTNLDEIKIGNLVYVSISADWNIKDYISGDSISYLNIKSESNIDFSDDMANEYITDHIYNALELSLYKLISDTSLKSKMISAEKTLKERISNWDYLEIKNSNNKTSSLAEASKSVVTIKNKDGHGSGCIISDDGYIITNYHVTGFNNKDLKVIFINGEEAECEIIRTNPIYDLSLIKVKGNIYEPFNMNYNKFPDLGLNVYAIGTPRDIELGQTLTQGIISGKRKFNDIVHIQSDVSINPGNSGGALIDANGLLLGIVTSKIIDYGVEGIGFAIPRIYIEEALKIKMESIKK